MTDRAVSVAEVTFRVAEPLTEPAEAVMVTFEATELVVTKPLLLTETEPGTEDVQFALAVMSSVLPSLKVAMAVNCCVVPAAMLAVEGIT